MDAPDPVQCAICLDDCTNYTCNSFVWWCEHTYHTHCIEQLQLYTPLDEFANCPLCRIEITSTVKISDETSVREYLTHKKKVMDELRSKYTSVSTSECEGYECESCECEVEVGDEANLDILYQNFIYQHTTYYDYDTWEAMQIRDEIIENELLREYEQRILKDLEFLEPYDEYIL